MSVVSRDELAAYCRLDEDELLNEAVQMADVMERRLISKGAVLTDFTKPAFGLAVKAMTLHELDHPGERIPQGIQDMINELKFANHKEE